VVITVLLVLVCSGVGALARFLLDGAVQSRRAPGFPLGTLVVNLGGAFLLGLLAGLAPPSRLMLLLGTATIGSYTTFSTWMLEVHRPAEDGEPDIARWNLAFSLAGGLLAVALGRAMGRAL
jgi:CrcB protein